MHDNNFEHELKGKINKYTRKYNNKYMVYFKTIFYCLTKMLKFPSRNKGNKIPKLPEDVLRIAIRLDGGLGDVLVYGLWLKEFSKIIKQPFLIDVFPSKNDMVSECSFKENSFINKIYNFNKFEDNIKNYDLTIAFRRFPHIVSFDEEKIKKYSENLLDFIEKYNNFQTNNNKFFTNNAFCDTLIDLYSICKGQKRIQQPDIDGLLNIDEKAKTYLPLNPKTFSFLEQNNLKNTQYITITRSVELIYNQEENVRLWPIEYYEELISTIKQEFPNIKIVQLGVSRCEELKGIDINLLGKTSLEEIKTILKDSILHIDGECGMVHVKHFLYGKSAVFFGQTAIEYLGYENNINLKSNGCAHWCEWILDDWQTHCLRGFKQPPCMTELKPDYVFENIKPYLNSVVSTEEKNVEIKEIKSVQEFFDNNDIQNSKIVFYGKEFLNIATNLNKNNKIYIYDDKIDNEQIENAKNSNILLDWGDIYNIPEENDSCDYVFAKDLSTFENPEFAKKELKRITKNNQTILLERKTDEQ